MLAISAFLLAVTAIAAPSADTQTVCDQLFARYPQYLAYDTLGLNAIKSALNALPYTQVTTQYWNKINSDSYRPACIFMPASAEHVSDAVQILNMYPDVPFALKGGGHNPAPGFSAIHEGLLIAFEINLGSGITERTPDGTHFIVGPGANWGGVYKVAGQTNQMIVGGRLAHVGVGGFLLGGGLSYLSSQYGLGCDEIDMFEAVLANGTIVQATATEHPDLWWALRGGGNQFAIVTRMWLRAYPEGHGAGQIWGGMRMYAPDQRYQVFRAITRFTRDYPDVRAAIVPTVQFGLPGNILNAITGPILLFFYDGPSPPPGVFDDFFAVKPLMDTTRTRRYADLVTELFGAAFTGFSQSVRITTYPNLPEDDQVAFFDACWNMTYQRTFADGLKGLDIQISGFDPQPMSVKIMEASARMGGNAIGLDPTQGDKLWYEHNYVWASPMCEEQCPQNSKELAAEMMAYHQQNFAAVPPTNYLGSGAGVAYSAASSNSYAPLFMNDAAPDQDVYSSYPPANLQRLMQIKQSYDPLGFLTWRQSGFRMPNMQGPVRKRARRHHHRRHRTAGHRN